MAQKQLHPGAKWVFRLRAFFISLVLAWFLGWLIMFPIATVVSVATSGNVVSLFSLGIIGVLIYILVVVFITEVYARMAYKRFLYEFTEDNLKVEKGIIWKRYSNIPYERVQNVDITRGILARMLGFSSVNIQTAGYSYTGRGMPVSEGYLPAVDMQEAEQIREFLMAKITKRGRSQGL